MGMGGPTGKEGRRVGGGEVDSEAWLINIMAPALAEGGGGGGGGDFWFLTWYVSAAVEEPVAA